MNTKTTKFLAVLAVLAMAFAAVAVVMPSDNGDATTSVQHSVVLKTSSSKLIATDTALGDDKEYYATPYTDFSVGYNGNTADAITVYVHGISTNSHENVCTNLGGSAYKGYAVLLVDITTLIGDTYTVIGIEQTSSAVKAFENDLGGKFYTDAAKGTLASWYSKADVLSNAGDKFVLAVLVPQDGSNIGLTLKYSTSAEDLSSYKHETNKAISKDGVDLIADTVKTFASVTLNLSGFTTQVELNDADLSGQGWSYSTSGYKLTLNGANGNLAFVMKANQALTVEVTQDSTLTPAIPSDLSTAKIFGAIQGYASKNVSVTGEKSLTIRMSIPENITLAMPTKANQQDVAICGIYSNGELTYTAAGLAISVTGAIPTKYASPEEEAKGNSGKYYCQAVFGLWSKGNLTVGDATSNSVKKVNLALNIATDEKLAWGIFDNASSSDITITATGYVNAGNRAVFHVSETSGDDIIFAKCGTEYAPLSLSAGENAIKGRANVTFTDSYVYATVMENKAWNTGANISAGLQVTGKLTMTNSTIETEGLRVKSGMTLDESSTESVLLVSGDYNQNPNADMDKIIAGIYAPRDLTAQLTAYDGIPTGVDVYIALIENAETYGNVKVLSASGEVTEDVITDTEAATVIEKISESTAETVKVMVTTNLDLNNAAAPIAITSAKDLVFEATDKTVSGFFKNDTNTVQLTNVKGNFTISQGSIVISGDIAEGQISIVGGTAKIGPGTIATTGNVTITADDDAIIILEDGLEIGTALTDYDLILTGPVTAGKKMTVQVLSDSTVKVLGTSSIVLTGDSTTPNNTTFNIMGNLLGTTGTLEAQVNTNVYVQTGANVTTILTGAGNFYTEDAMKDKEISGDVASDLYYTAQQRVIVVGTVNVLDGATLSIAGELYVPEGSKLVVKNGGEVYINGVMAKADIDGTVVIEGANGFTFSGKEIDVDGTVNVKADSTTSAFTVTAGDLYVNSEMTIGSKSVAALNTGITVNEFGVLTIKGTVSGEVKANYGTVVMNGAVDGLVFAIFMQDGGAVDIQSVDGYLLVSDLGLKFTSDYKVDGITWKANGIGFTDVQGITIESAIKVDLSKTALKDQYTNLMYVSGVATPLKNSLFYGIDVVSGTVTVASDSVLDMGKVGMVIHSGAKLSIAGTVYATSEDFADFDGAGSIALTGTLQTRHDEGFAIGNSLSITAVMYTQKQNDVNYDFYTSLAAALASGEKDLTVFGKLTISKDTTIPAGVELEASSSDVTVKSTATLTLADGCEVTAKSITVDGTMIVEDREDLNCNNIYSDTSSINETSALYTNIAQALANASSGDYIKITKKLDAGATEAYAYLRTSAVIKEGVTLEIPASKALVITIGCTLDVQGKLYVNQGALYANTKTGSTGSDTITGHFGIEPLSSAGAAQAAVITVDGVVESTYSLPYGTINNSGVCTATGMYGMIGAYFESKAKYYITTVEASAETILDADSYKVVIEGPVTVSTVAFTGTSTKNVTIEVNDDIVALSMTVDYGNIYFKTENKLITGTFGTSAGTATFVAAYTGGTTGAIGDIAVTDDDGVTERLMYVEGSFKKPTSDQEEDLAKTALALTLSGDVFVKNALTLTDNYDTYGGMFVIGLGAEVYFGKTATTTAAITTNGDMGLTTYIYGSLYMLDSALFTGSSVYVYGELETLDVPTTKHAAAGKFTATNLYIGGSLYDDETTAASVTGLSTRDITGAYVFPEATVAGDIAEDMQSISAKYNEFYIEGNLWMTVFALDGDVKLTDGDKAILIVPNLDEKKFVTWYYISLDKAVNIADTKDVTVGVGSNAALIAEILYEVYTVVVAADPGIDALYVDGYLMPYVSDRTLGEVYKVDVAAGKHVLEYKIANGYSGTPYMVVNGEKVLGGYGFNAGGDYDTEVVDYMIYFQGIEKSGYVPEPEPTPEPEKESEWNVTTILLLVLVILIAIMAVIVALRLNRN